MISTRFLNRQVCGSSRHRQVRCRAVGHSTLRSLLLAGSLLFGFSYAQNASQETSQTLQAFLEPLENYAGITAARADVRAAEIRLRQAYDPVGVDASTGYSYAPNEGDESGLSADLDVSFRPFVFGDNADLVRERELALATARLNYLAALTQLEAQALEAATRFQWGAEAVDVAQQRVEVADLALRGLQAQVERGAGSGAAVREAEQELAAAQASVEEAQLTRALAESELNALVGEVRLSEMPSLPPPDGTALQVRLARVEVALARLGVRRAERELYPELDANYIQNLGGGNAVAASIGSRNLEPTLGYDHRYQRDDDALETRFEVSLSVSLSTGAFAALDAAKEDLTAANERLDAASSEAALETERLTNVLAQAQEGLRLAQARFSNAEASLEEVQGREALGLTTPLDVQRATLTLSQALLDLQTEQQLVRTALLDLYRYYALPLSEALEEQP